MDIFKGYVLCKRTRAHTSQMGVISRCGVRHGTHAARVKVAEVMCQLFHFVVRDAAIVAQGVVASGSSGTLYSLVGHLFNKHCSIKMFILRNKRILQRYFKESSFLQQICINSTYSESLSQAIRYHYVTTLKLKCINYSSLFFQ